MTDPGISGQRIDHAADAAISTHADEGDGRGSASPAAHTELATGEDDVPTLPSADPGHGRGDHADDLPATEGNRQLVETVRSIERLEESN